MEYKPVGYKPTARSEYYISGDLPDKLKPKPPAPTPPAPAPRPPAPAPAPPPAQPAPETGFKPTPTPPAPAPKPPAPAPAQPAPAPAPPAQPDAEKPKASNRTPLKAFKKQDRDIFPLTFTMGTVVAMEFEGKIVLLVAKENDELVLIE